MLDIDGCCIPSIAGHLVLELLLNLQGSSETAARSAAQAGFPSKAAYDAAEALATRTLASATRLNAEVRTVPLQEPDECRQVPYSLRKQDSMDACA